MSISAQIALDAGVLGPGQNATATVTVFNNGSVAVQVLGIQGYLFNSGTQQRAPGAHEGYGTTPGFTTSVPAGGSLQFRGNVTLRHGQPLQTQYGTSPANDVRYGAPVSAGSPAITGPMGPFLQVDAFAVVYTTGAGADAQVQSNRATVVYSGALPALTGDGAATAFETVNGTYPMPAAAPGQLWFDRTTGFNTALEALLCP